jgi:hypothetical protein
MAFELSKSLNGLLNTLSVPSLGSEQRAESMPLSRLKDELETAISQANLRGENAVLVRSTALLWHDHLDESHAISQGISNSDGSFLHAIMHRREPDYPNAKYWFNRVGTHDAFPDIFNRAKTILTGTSLAHLVKGEWDPFALVDSVSQAGPNSAEYELLQQVQQIEFEVLLKRFCN